MKYKFIGPGNNVSNVFAKLRRLARPQNEQCAYCSAGIASTHRHLLEIASKKIICVCDSCALLFQNLIGDRRLIPRDSRALPGFQMTDAEWESLGLPIGLAFFYRSSVARKVVAMYPSPAGGTEWLLPLRSWQKLEASNPILAELETDVEALLVNRLGTAREYYVTPIDVCFELVGLIRLHWRGFSGGEEVFQKLGEFFSKVGQASRLHGEGDNVRSQDPIRSPTLPDAGIGTTAASRTHA